MFTYKYDICEMDVPAFLVPGIHCQFRTSVNDVKRGTDVMRYGEDDVLTSFQQFVIFVYDTLHLFPQPHIMFLLVPDHPKGIY